MTRPPISDLTGYGELAYQTPHGAALVGDALYLLGGLSSESVQLVMTSPPFALLRQKEYGNRAQDAYIEWFVPFAREVFRVLRADGSFVLDLGGAYERGRPIRSLYNFRLLIKLCDDLGFMLAQDFYWFNPSKLPSPIEWVNKRKLRAKDAVNTVWWLAKTADAKADIARVLTPYSSRMKKLLRDPERFYSPKRRPSGHDIGSRFGTDKGGAIPSNLLQIPNTESNSAYLRGCLAVGAKPHPARFPSKLPQFFIKFLTTPGDLIVDPFAGSNTTGMAAESERRFWLAFDNRRDYIALSVFRFLSDNMTASDARKTYETILHGTSVQVDQFDDQATLELG